MKTLSLFMTISRWILHKVRNTSNKSCRESKNTHFTFSNFFRKSCRLRDNMNKYGGVTEAADDNMAARCMLDNQNYTRASTRPRARKHTQKYVILFAFPLQQWLRKRASILCCKYIACPFFLLPSDFSLDFSLTTRPIWNLSYPELNTGNCLTYAP
jgi:hypothetical protein